MRPLAGVCAFSVTPAAQAPRFRSRITTIPVTVTVSDSAGRLITGLTRDDFEIYEDGIREPITRDHVDPADEGKRGWHHLLSRQFE